MKNYFILLFTLMVVFYSCNRLEEKKEPISITLIDCPAINATNRFNVSNRTPLQPLHFINLPIGNMQPQGWRLKYLELQRDGLTGHLGKISAWLEKENNARLSKDGTGDYGWEEVPYWLIGYEDMAYMLDNQKMMDESKTWRDAAVVSQRKDGYFGSMILKDGKPDLWGNMIMLWCPRVL